jgi:hypothetical protein
MFIDSSKSNFTANGEMTKAEIRKRIIKVLDVDYPSGLTSERLREAIGINDRDSKNADRFYKVKPEMEKCGELKYHETLKVNYLLKHEEEMLEKWWPTKNNPVKIVKKVKCIFLYIKQGVFSQRRGRFTKLGEYSFDDSIPHSGLLDKFAKVDDNSDFLFFRIENNNPVSITDIEASIYIVPSLLKTTESENKNCHKCKYYTDYGYITINCDKLHGYESGMSHDSAYALIPVTRLNKQIELGRDIPNIKVKYNDLEIKNIYGAEITFGSNKGVPFTISED